MVSLNALRQQGGCECWCAEIGYGADMTDRVFLTQQIWIEEGNQSASSIKTVSQFGVYFGAVDVLLGYREETGGQFEETAVLIAVVAPR